MEKSNNFSNFIKTHALNVSVNNLTLNSKKRSYLLNNSTNMEEMFTSPKSNIAGGFGRKK